jgi:hypothetical protein
MAYALFLLAFSDENDNNVLCDGETGSLGNPGKNRNDSGVPRLQISPEQIKDSGIIFKVEAPHFLAYEAGKRT